MLPPGHIAGGYLVGFALARIFEPSLTIDERHGIIFLAMATAFAPDLDMFFSFFKLGSMRLAKGASNHRLLVTHTPFFWLIFGIGVFFALGATAKSGYVALAITLGALSHLVLDSIQYGIQWLYPFSKQLYSIRDRGVELDIEYRGFFTHWAQMTRAYARRFTLTFSLEIILIITAISIAIFL